MNAVRFVQYQSFGAAISLLQIGTPDDYDQILKKLSRDVVSPNQMRKLNELKSLRNFRPCVDSDLMLRVEGRLENAELPVDTRHPFIIPSRHAFTRLIVLNEHILAGHAGPLYTLTQTRQQFWITFGNGSVKHYIADCGECALQRAKPVRQSLSDLPSFRVTRARANKPFQICGTDFLGPIRYRQGRSDCKAWGLLFTCLSNRCLHVEIVTGLDLNNFLLAFSRFTNLRGSVETIYSDNGCTFCAAADTLPSLLGSCEFTDSLRKKRYKLGTNPSLRAEARRKLGNNGETFQNRVTPSCGSRSTLATLIELQTFTLDAVRIINDRPLTTLSDQPNDLLPVTPLCFLGQGLAPYTLLGKFHDKGDLRRDYTYNATLAHKLWLSWVKGYLTNLKGRKKWRTCKENLYLAS